MNKEKVLFRSRILVSLILIVFIIFMYLLFRQSSAIHGLNADTDELRKDTLTKLNIQETIEGTITDCDGEILSEATEAGVSGTLVFPKLYSWLIGYNDVKYGSFGLKGKYKNYLYMQGQDKKGAQIKLTLDNDLQAVAANEIADTDGSMVVMEVKTGKILALASSREDYSLNANEITSENMAFWNDIDGFFLPNGYKDPAEPGSVFKIVTASAVLEQGADDKKVDDKGELEVQGHTVINNNRVARGKIGLQQALGYSSNVYFATKAMEMGGAAIRHKAEDFLIGEEIPLDFTTLTSNLDLGNYEDSLVADTGYGQGNTLMSPLHIAMVGQSIANKGVMLKPYMIDQISLNGRKMYEGEKVKLAQPVEKETAAQLKDMLHTVATDYYKLDEYGICSKTGTAQIPGNMLKCYFLAFNDDYVVLVTKRTDDGYGRDLMEHAVKMFKALEERK